MAKIAVSTVALVVFGLLLVNKLVTVSPPARAQEVEQAPGPPAPALAAPPLPIRSVAVPAAMPAAAARDFGITEQGRGVVSLPADRLVLTIRSFGNIAMRAPGAAAGAPSPDEIEKNVVDVMRSNGIPDARIETPIVGTLSMNDQLVGTIAKPTHDSVSAIEEHIVTKLPSQVLPLLRSVNVLGALEVDDCSAAVDRARTLAYADARKRAEALASAAGMHLGGLLGASETDQTAGCPSQSNGFPINPYNANEAMEKMSIDVGVTISASFALRP